MFLQMHLFTHRTTDAVTMPSSIGSERGQWKKKKKRNPTEIINAIHILYSHHCTTLHKKNIYQETVLYIFSRIKPLETVNYYVLKHKSCWETSQGSIWDSRDKSHGELNQKPHVTNNRLKKSFTAWCLAASRCCSPRLSVKQDPFP